MMADAHVEKRTIVVELSPSQRKDFLGLAGAVRKALQQAQVEIRIESPDLSARDREWIRDQVEQMMPACLLMVGGEGAIVQEAEQPISIPAWAYLRSMAAVAWSAFRHPLETTEIDLTTGRIVARS
jgi:hypothetical protein